VGLILVRKSFISTFIIVYRYTDIDNRYILDLMLEFLLGI
jgi:hypothetical protein